MANLKPYFSNNKQFVITHMIHPTTTVIRVHSGQGLEIPPNYTHIIGTLVPMSGLGDIEIVHITKIEDNEFTIERAQEDTSAQRFLPGAVLELRLTAGWLNATSRGRGESAIFKLGTESTSFGCAYTNLGTFNKILPIINIVAGDTPVNTTLFEPVAFGWNHIYKFKYIGTEPLYGRISGGIEYLLCKNSRFKDPNIGSTDRLQLVCHTPERVPSYTQAPPMALGETKFLRQDSMLYLDQDEFNDQFPPASKSVTNTWRGQRTNINTGTPEKGFIEAGSNSAVLSPSETALTTAWMPVEPNKIYYLDALDGTKSRNRVQFKRANGSIVYSSARSGATQSTFVITPLTSDITEMRVYYKQTKDTCQNLAVYDVSTTNTARDNVPFHGKWDLKSITVEKDVVFYPDCEYSIQLAELSVHGEFVNTTTNFRILSGGFTVEEA